MEIIVKTRFVLLTALLFTSAFVQICTLANTALADYQLQISNVRVTDTTGNPLTVVQVKQQILIQFDVSNLGSSQQSAAYELKILGIKGTYFDASSTFHVSPSQKTSQHELWAALLPGQYAAQISIFQSLANHTSLSQPVSLTIVVGTSNNVPQTPTNPSPTPTNPLPTPTNPSPTVPIPDWVKNNTKLWHDNKIGDSLFLQTIKFLIINQIIKVQSIGSSTLVNTIPSWIKASAGWWTGGQISDSEFINEIQYLIDKRIIII